MPAVLLLIVGMLVASPVRAEEPAFPAHVELVESKQSFAAYMKKLLAAIGANGMGVVAQACATCGAKSIGIEIPENRVVMIFNPHFAVRLLKVSIPAGVEAPLRLYVTERKDGTALLSYQKPSDVFASYKNPTLDKMAKELDQVVANIVHAAAQ